MARTNKRFAGKVALITGGGGGQGKVQGRMLAEQGATVVLADVADAAGKAAAAAIRKAGGNAEYVRLDVTAAADWEKVMRAIRRKHGALHVLVNNAGIVSRTNVHSISLREWQRVIDVNLTGPMLGIKAAAPLMRDSGGGAVVNISSTA